MSEHEMRIQTRDVAERVLRRHFALAESARYAYPEVLSLQAAVNLELATGDAELRRWNRALLRPFVAGELTQRMGAYWLYNLGGAGTARLVQLGLLPEAEEAVARGAEELVRNCPRGPEGFLAYQTNDRRGPEQVWIDMVFATCPFLVFAGLHFGRDEWLDEAVDQLAAMHTLFWDSACGLYNQAVNIRGAGHRTEDHWSRGNGWGILGLCEVAAHLPERVARRNLVRQLLHDHLAACLAHQDGEGMWHQEMTDPTSYVETSGTGLILYALGVALEHGLCPPEWRSALLRGLRGYLGYIALDGSVHNCCIGCMCPGEGTQADYKAREWRRNDHHAFGPAALAFGQAHRLGIRDLTL